MSQLNASQVRILQVLAGSPAGMTREQLEEAAPDASPSPTNLGPAYKDTMANPIYAESLIGLGYVKQAVGQLDGKDVILWRTTAKGEKVARTHKPNGVSARGVSIPNSTLDPIIRRMKAVRTYGLNQWTDADVEELRRLLPMEFHEVPYDVLRTKIVGRRQAGAFADPAEQRRKAVERAIREFGPDGSIMDLLTAEQLEQLLPLLE